MFTVSPSGARLRSDPAARAGAFKRLAFVAATAAMLGGCWFYGSDVSAFSQADRPAESPLADGVYCALEAGADAFELSTSDCMRYAWNDELRLIRLSELADADDQVDDGDVIDMSVAPIGDGLILLEFENVDASEAEARFAIAAAAAVEEGYVLVPRPPAATSVEIAQSTGAVLGAYDAESDIDYPRIIGGAPEAVRDFIARSARAWLAAPGPEGLDKFAPEGAADAADGGSAENDGFLRPQYYLRIEALPDGVDREAGAAQSYARVRAELERLAAR